MRKNNIKPQNASAVFSSASISSVCVRAELSACTLQESGSTVHTARASKRKWCCWWEQDKIKDPMVQFLSELL